MDNSLTHCRLLANIPKLPNHNKGAMTFRFVLLVAAVLGGTVQPSRAFDEANYVGDSGPAWGQPPASSLALEPDRMPSATRSLPPIGSTRLRLGEIPTNLPRDLTIAPADLWDRIRNGFGLPDLDSPLVKEQESWYATRPDYIKRMAERSQRYLFYIVEEIEKRGMPSEIALLPMIESAYSPTAYSRSHASGIWQFIPSTGKHYGLQQNWWHDERRDVLAATRAALDYLQKLYDQFGSWDLALASYNWGEGAVARAIAKNQARGRPADYQSLDMPRETRYYVPKLQAVKNIVADPARFKLALAAIPNQPYFATVAMPQNIDVKLAARLAEMPLDEFLSLNPSYKRPVIRSDGDRTLLLPADRIGVFSTNLGSHDKPLVSWQAYTPRKGESLGTIAIRFGTTPSDLVQANSLPTTGRFRLNGQPILVPAHAHAGTESLSSVDAPAAVEEPASTTVARLHVVRKGETLAGIARQYGISTQQVVAWNKLRGNQVSKGQRLTVGEQVTTAPRAGRVATAKPGAQVAARNGKHAGHARGSARTAKATPNNKRVAVAYQTRKR